MTSNNLPLCDLVDLDRYPIDDPSRTSYQRVVADARAQLDATGCALHKDFVRSDALPHFAREIEERKSQTHFSRQDINPTFTPS